MTFPRSMPAVSLLALALLAPPLAAQDNFTSGVNISDSDPNSADLFVDDNAVFDGQVCIGNGCADNDLLDVDVRLEFKSASNIISFTDTSANPGVPSRDWQLLVNDVSGVIGRDRFSVKDLDAGTIPFTIEGGAPENALWIGDEGNIGIRTIFPQTDLHIKGDRPAIMLEDTSSTTTPDWYMDTQAGGALRLRHSLEPYPNSAVKLILYDTNGASDWHVVSISGEGNLKLGSGFTDSEAIFIGRDDSSARIKVEETDPTLAPRTLLNLQNNGRPEIVMGNSSTGGEWSFGAGTNFILKQGTVGSDSSAKTKLFEISPAGDAILAGSLTTGGTTCGGGCDRVFSDDYNLPSIAEHSERMFALGHLPNVGPALEGEPFNLTEKVGRMLNELEHAHIYIAELEERDDSKTDRIEMLEAEVRRLSKLEVRFTALEAKIFGE